MLPPLAAEAAVGAAAEVGTRVDFGLASGDDGLATFFKPFVLGEEGSWRAAVGLGVFREVRLMCLGDVGGFSASLGDIEGFSACSDVATVFADSATATGLEAEPLVMGFSSFGDIGTLGVLGEVGDFAEDLAGGTCLVGGGFLIGFASLVMLSFVGGGGLW